MSKKKDAIHTRFPSPISKKAPLLSKEKKIDFIATRFREILEVLGLDLADPSLQKTPERIARMYVNEIFSGLDDANFPHAALLEEEAVAAGGHHSMIVTQCSFVSICEHHFVPMIGTAYVGYVPNGRLIGLSKLHRLVRFFAARPQLQERLTAQIADSLSTLVATRDVACTITAQHSCVLMRGVKDESGRTTTNYFSGTLKRDPVLQEEFFRTIERLTRER
jgi:GTP cyclohydrolase I